MAREEEPWVDKPYEAWGQKVNIAEKTVKWRIGILLAILLVIVLAPMQWVLFSDIVLWDRDGVTDFGLWMSAFFLIGNPVGLYLSTKRLSGALHYLYVFTVLLGCIGALGVLLIPAFLLANYTFDFSEPEIIAITVSDIKQAGKVGKVRSNLTLIMNQEPFETQTLRDQTRKYGHIRIGERTWLVTGRGFFGVRYIYEIRSNPPPQGAHEKLRFSVPSGLRPPVAPELAR